MRECEFHRENALIILIRFIRISFWILDHISLCIIYNEMVLIFINLFQIDNTTKSNISQVSHWLEAAVKGKDLALCHVVLLFCMLTYVPMPAGPITHK